MTGNRDRALSPWIQAHWGCEGWRSPPPQHAAELGFTRVRPPINWPKSDRSDFGWRDREGACKKMERARSPPPHPPPPGAPRDAERRGDPVAGEGAHRDRGATPRAMHSLGLMLRRRPLARLRAPSTRDGRRLEA